MTVRKAEKRDLPILAALACRLWPHHTAEEMMADYSAGMINEDAAFFLAYAEGTPVGFAQCQLRHDYVEGTASSPVGYLEGIYVAEEYRKHGIARVCCLPVKAGQRRWVAGNLPATASWTIWKA